MPPSGKAIPTHIPPYVTMTSRNFARTGRAVEIYDSDGSRPEIVDPLLRDIRIRDDVRLRQIGEEPFGAPEVETATQK